ncbi:RING-H2 finger protein [Endozoicomonas lisbonensis]
MNGTPPLSPAPLLPVKSSAGMTDDQFTTFKQEGCSLCHETDVTESRLKRSVCKADVIRTLCNHPFHKNCLIKHFSKCLGYRGLSPTCPTCQYNNPVSEEDRLLLESALVRNPPYIPGKPDKEQILKQHKDSPWVPAIQNTCLRMRFETYFDTGHSRYWLKVGATITDEELSELLRWSIKENRLNNVMELFEIGATLESEELSALAEKASDENQLDLLKYLIYQGGSLSADKINHHFREAIKNNNDKCWLETLKDLNAKLPPEELNSYCIEAAKCQSMQMVRRLLSWGAKPTAEDWNDVFRGFADNNHSTATLYLKGMGIEPVTEHCNTGFRNAVAAGCFSDAKMWKSLGAEPNAEKLNILVKEAAQRNDYKTVSTLIEFGAKLNKDEFRDLIQQAAKKGQDQLCLRLLQKGPEATTNDINAFFMRAIKKGDDLLANEWIKLGVELPTETINTLLNHPTGGFYDRNIVRLLMTLGGKPDVNHCNYFFAKAVSDNSTMSFTSDAQYWLDQGASPENKHLMPLCRRFNLGHTINDNTTLKKEANLWADFFTANPALLESSYKQAVDQNAPEFVEAFFVLGFKPSPDCIRSGFSRAATAGNFLSAKKWKKLGKKINVELSTKERDIGFWAAIENKDLKSAKKWKKYIGAKPRLCELNERLSRAQAENDTDMTAKLKSLGAQPATL